MRVAIRRLLVALTAMALLATTASPASAADGNMADGLNGWTVDSIFTIGESIGDYTPPGVIDGLGAYRLDRDTVRVFANHELLHFRGYGYEVSDGAGGTFSMNGARISYFDIDRRTRQIVDSGLAYDTVYDANGDIATDLTFQPNDLAGFSRFCSGSLFEAHQFHGHRGLEDRIYFAGEEDGGFFSPVGGALWALDPETGNIWHVPDAGRGAWENVTVIDTGRRDSVALLLADDTSPFDFDENGTDDAVPLYLYVGQKDRDGDFLARNGLRGGKLFAWVADNGATSPADFNTSGTLHGRWVEVDNAPTGTPSNDGSTGYDHFGYPTQGNLVLQAQAQGAFGFSRPEDIATNPRNGREAVMASTGVDNYVDGADSFGTLYTIKTNFRRMSAAVTIIYDGDADPTRALRSPDNLDWADDGRIYVQEDEAEETTLTGEPLWGEGAANPNEAGIVSMRSNGRQLERIANVDRNVVLDPTTGGTPVDVDAGDAGEWESSGILDVSRLFGTRPGTLFLFNVEAHGIEDQDDFNADSRINDGDLVEGGQLLFLQAPRRGHQR